MKIACRFWWGEVIKGPAEPRSAWRRRGLERHLAACDRCWGEWHGLEVAGQHLHAMKENRRVPAHAADAERAKAALRQAIAEDSGRPVYAPGRRRVPVPAWVAVGAAAGLGLGVLATGRLAQRGPGPFPCRVEGQVTAADKRTPAPGAWVAALSPDQFQRVLPAMKAGGKWPSSPEAQTRADAGGRFGLPLLHPGTYYIVSKSGEKGLLQWDVVAANQPSQAVSLNISLRSGAQSSDIAPGSAGAGGRFARKSGGVRGRVLLPGGKKPAPGVAVVPYRLNQAFYGHNSSYEVRDSVIYVRTDAPARTDAQGRFRVGMLPDGEFRLAAFPPGMEPLQPRPDPTPPYRFAAVGEFGPVQVEQGKAVDAGEVVLPAAGVLSVALVPLVGHAGKVLLTLSPQDIAEDSSPTLAEWARRRDAFTSAAGRMTVGGLAAGVYTIAGMAKEKNIHTTGIRVTAGKVSHTALAPLPGGERPSGR